MSNTGKLCIALLLFFVFLCQTRGVGLISPHTRILASGNNHQKNSSLTATGTIAGAKAKFTSGMPKDDLQANSLTTKATRAIAVKNVHLNINPAYAEFDEALYAILQQNKIPGLSVAISKNGKVVYAQSYGYANTETGEQVSNKSLFRIASLSKPVTKAAILKLMQEEVISLEDKVFGPEGIFKDEYPVPFANAAVKLITVKDLLEHKAGWTKNTDDTLFEDPAITAQDIIMSKVLNQPLDSKPGSTYHYSNLGYSILGRIIEKVSGKSYAEFVKENMLLPAGIHGMQIGGDTEQQRAMNEVKYYQQEYNPYSYNMARMDAHGGWLATATDLVRFMNLVDRNSNNPERINNSLLDTTYFGYPNWTHYGSLPGTTAVMSSLNEEYNFVALANTRNNSLPNHIADEITRVLKGIILSKEEWPAPELI